MQQPPQSPIRSDLIAAGYEGPCLVDADSPTLPASLLAEAITSLRAPGDRVVLGPATDGGYDLIGLKHPHRHLFHDIAWSTERYIGRRPNGRPGSDSS